MCDFLEHIGSIIISYLNKHAFSVTEVFDRCETSERYSLLLFSFVVSQMPLGSIVCRWYRVIIEEPEMLNINTFSEVTNVMEQKIYRFLEEKQKKTGIKLVEERYERFRRM